MKTQQLLMVLTVANAALLLHSLMTPSRTAAQGVPPVLRARALEIVDEQGRVRAELKVLPADPRIKMPDGTTGYPETVLLRLITSKGGPNVKLSTIEDGAGLVVGSETGYTQILTRGSGPMVKLAHKDGREQTLKP